MNYKSVSKAISIALAVSLFSGCSITNEKAQDEGVVLEPTPLNIYKNVTYDANIRVDGYFKDQFVIFKQLFSNFTVSNEKKHEIKIIIPSDYGYKTGSWAMNRELRNQIGEMAQTLNDYKETSIWVYGHTDTVGNLSSNIELSQKRADAVRDLLLANKVDVSRIKTVAEAYEMPRCDNKSMLGRNCNRRVEIIVKGIAL